MVWAKALWTTEGGKNFPPFPYIGEVQIQQVAKLEDSIKTAGFDVEYIHTGPVIRREEVFAKYSIDERRKLLYKMLNFVNECPISYLTVIIDRKEAMDKIALSGKLAKVINRAINEHMEFFYKPQELKKTFLKSVEKKKL